MTVNVASSGSKSAGWPPDDIAYYSLTVSGHDMATEKAVFPGTADAIAMIIPRGKDRHIEVEAFKNPLSEEAIISWRGSVTMDLIKPLSSVIIPMILGETKLLAADPASDGGTAKLFQIDDMSDLDLGTRQILEGDLGVDWPGYTFEPYDLEMDKRGRIYVANNPDSSDEAVLWRVDSISDTSPEIIIDTSHYGYEALGIDQLHDLLYVGAFDYASGLTYYIIKCDVDGNNLSSLDISTGVEEIYIIRGIAVDSGGLLYVAGENISDEDRIFKYDPVAQEVLESYSNPNFNQLSDIKITDNFIYVTNMSGADGWKIIRLDIDFSNPIGYGKNADDINHNPGYFYGPRRFISGTNKNLAIIDDYASGVIDKIVLIDDIYGTNWDTLPSDGDGQFYFTFYTSVGMF